MTLGSLFDGIGGFPLSAVLHGIEPVWASEIEKFPIEVTKIRFPNMKHLGDITNINGAEIEPVDIITFGSPCQDLSVAGKREGLVDGKRSNLFYQAVRIIREMREATNGNYPTFAIWENVPGAFSSNGGQDFRSVLEEITEAEIPMPKSGKWANAGMVRGVERSLAWRTLDAQYWGVPQRRKRIFLVADFAGQRAGEILLEQQSVHWNPAESGEEGEETSSRVRTGFDGAICIDHVVTTGGNCTAQGPCYKDEMSFTLKASGVHAVMQPESGKAREEVAAGVESSIAYSMSAKQQSLNVGVDMANTLGANDYKEPQVVAFRMVAFGEYADDDTASAMKARDYKDATDLVVPIHDQATRFAGKRGDKQDGKGNGLGVGNSGDPMFTMTQGDRHAVAFTPSQFGQYQEGVGTLRSSGGDYGGGSENLVSNNYTVRRLTPTECERLQGFPDNWTNIPGASDTGRYKALGNGVALPCVTFVLRQIKDIADPPVGRANKGEEDKVHECN